MKKMHPAQYRVLVALAGHTEKSPPQIKNDGNMESPPVSSLIQTSEFGMRQKCSFSVAPPATTMVVVFGIDIPRCPAEGRNRPSEFCEETRDQVSTKTKWWQQD